MPKWRDRAPGRAGRPVHLVTSGQLLVGPETCALVSFLRERPERDSLEILHAEVHAAASTQRGGPVHRDAWGRLVSALGEG